MLSRTAETYYEMSRAHSLISDSLARSRTKSIATEDVLKSETHARAAVDMLALAHRAGYPHSSYIRADWPAPLRSRTDFQNLMMDIDFPSDPFLESGVIDE